MAAEQFNQLKVDKGIKLEEFFETQLKIFKFFGLNIIPAERNSTKAKVIEKLMKFYFYLCIIGFIIVSFQFAVQILNNLTNTRIIILTLPNVVAFPYNCSKGILFFISRTKILQLLEKLKTLYPETMLEQQNCQINHQLKRSRIFNRIYILAYFGIILLAGGEIMYQFIFNNVRKLTAEIWYPFDPFTSNLNFLYSLIWGCWSIYNAIFVTISVDLFLCAIFLILSMEFQIVGENIKKGINLKEFSKLHEFINQHQYLTNINDEIKSSFEFIMFYTFIQGAAAVASSIFLIFATTSIGELLFSLSYASVSLIQIFYTVILVKN